MGMIVESQESINKINDLPQMLGRAFYPVQLTRPWNELTQDVRDEVFASLRYECPQGFAPQPGLMPEVEARDTQTWVARFRGWRLPPIVAGYWEQSDRGYVVAHEESVDVSHAEGLWVRKSVYGVTHGNLIVRALLPQKGWDKA